MHRLPDDIQRMIDANLTARSAAALAQTGHKARRARNLEHARCRSMTASGTLCRNFTKLSGPCQDYCWRHLTIQVARQIPEIEAATLNLMDEEGKKGEKIISISVTRNGQGWQKGFEHALLNVRIWFPSIARPSQKAGDIATIDVAQQIVAKHDSPQKSKLKAILKAFDEAGTEQLAWQKRVAPRRHWKALGWGAYLNFAAQPVEWENAIQLEMVWSSPLRTPPLPVVTFLIQVVKQFPQILTWLEQQKPLERHSEYFYRETDLNKKKKK